MANRILLAAAALAGAALFITAAHAQLLPSPCPLPPVEYDHPFRGTLIFSEGHDQPTMHKLCRAPFVIDIPACVIENIDDRCALPWRTTNTSRRTPTLVNSLSATRSAIATAGPETIEEPGRSKMT
jgi:hypothetical protein